MSKLDDERLLHRIHNFFGYGRYESDYWFIGNSAKVTPREERARRVRV